MLPYIALFQNPNWSSIGRQDPQPCSAPPILSVSLQVVLLVPSQCLGKQALVAIIHLPQNHLEVQILLVLRQGVRSLAAHLLVSLGSLLHLPLVLHQLQLLGVPCLHLGHHQLLLLAALPLPSVVLPCLVRSQPLEALVHLLANQVLLVVHFSKHSQHLGTAFLVPHHHLVHPVNLHLVPLPPPLLDLLAPLLLVLQLPQLLVPQAHPHLGQHRHHRLVLREVPLGSQVLQHLVQQ